jgi:hypothetical protein
MATVRDYVYPNRQLRNIFLNSIKSHQGFIDFRYSPIIFLTLKILRNHEALESLTMKDFGSESSIVLRSMFESTINLMWITKDNEVRLIRYFAYQVFIAKDYFNKTKKWVDESNLPETRKVELFKELEDTIKHVDQLQNKYNFNNNQNWSGLKIKQMAEEVGWIDRYNTVYKITSNIMHSNYLGSSVYFLFDSNGKLHIDNNNEINLCKASLDEAYIYLLNAFNVLNVILDLKMDEYINNKMAQLPRKTDK